MIYFILEYSFTSVSISIGILLIFVFYLSRDHPKIPSTLHLLLSCKIIMNCLVQWHWSPWISVHCTIIKLLRLIPRKIWIIIYQNTEMMIRKNKTVSFDLIILFIFSWDWQSSSRSTIVVVFFIETQFRDIIEFSSFFKFMVYLTYN